MMDYFYQVSSIWQIVLLVISQFSVISLAAGVILLLKRKSNMLKIIAMGVIILVNTILYILMQLDSRITGAKQGINLNIPYLVLMLITLINIILGAWMVLSVTKNRKTINNSSIKESFDNLPTGVCFFNESGLPVLCNQAMQRFSFAVCGKDVQYITDLEYCLDEAFVPATNAKKDGLVFVLPDGSAWYLEKRTFTNDRANHYTQYIATDVTELHENRIELQQETERLSRVQSNLKVLSANIVTVTREEEILNTKMRVHDEMGRCLVTAQKYLKDDLDENIPDDVISSWQRAVSMLKYNNEIAEENMMSQIYKTCKTIKLDFIQNGVLPKEEGVAYILTCAVRECVTNAVRYAGATELYADFAENETEASVVVYNNGKTPNGEVVEGGGLSTLRRKVERAGGSMIIESYPKFKLIVTLPIRKESVL